MIGRLGVRRQREREGLVLFEGIRAVREALDARAFVRFAVVSDALSTSASGRVLEERIRNAGIDVDVLGAAAFDSISATESPQGVLLVCEQDEVALSDVVETEGPILVLDALQDPGNVGTLIRTAVAFGFAGVIALDGTTDPWSPKVVRSSAGSVARVPVVRAAAGEAMAALRQSGRAILVAAADGSAGDHVGPARIALVIGNEGAGVREEIRAQAEATITVRMAGPVESLNASVAGAILMYDLTRE